MRDVAFESAATTNLPDKVSEGEVGNVGLTEKQKKRKALMPFVIISLSYLLYTITDGSVRMIVLLHAYNKSFSAMEVPKSNLVAQCQRSLMNH